MSSDPYKEVPREKLIEQLISIKDENIRLRSRKQFTSLKNKEPFKMQTWHKVVGYSILVLAPSYILGYAFDNHWGEGIRGALTATTVLMGCGGIIGILHTLITHR